MENYGPASAQFAQFVKQFPDHELIGPAYYSLGWSYFKQGDYKNAIEPLETFRDEYEPPEVALYPYETDTQLRIGDSYYAIGDYTEAIAQYQKEIGAEPGGDYAMFQIANSYYRNDQSYEAVTNFRKFLRIYPYSRFREQAQYNIAYIYLNTGNYTQAVEEFNRVINKYPNTSWAARAQYNIGDAYYNAGDYEQAVNAYKKVMEDYPDSEYIIEAVNGIQYAQLSAGEADSSSAILQDFLEDHPQTSMADRLRFRQADNRMQMGDYEAAVEEFQQYIRITNSLNLLPDAYFNLASAYEEIGEKEEAITQYQKVVAEFPNSRQAAHALSELGRMAFVDGNYQESFGYFKRLSEHKDADIREAYVGMGDARLAMKDLKSARKFYERVIDTDSDYAGAVVGLGKIALYSESYEQAQQLFEKVAESSSTESGAEAQYMLGKVQQEQRNFNEAIEAYSKVTILFEAHEEWVRKALLDRARSLIRLGRTGDARSALNTLVEDYPDTPEAREAGRLLKNN
jgi:tetratricopeptide (TPR) repeat protein